jgi:hypothetical protein
MSDGDDPTRSNSLADLAARKQQRISSTDSGDEITAQKTTSQGRTANHAPERNSAQWIGANQTMAAEKEAGSAAYKRRMVP